MNRSSRIDLCGSTVDADNKRRALEGGVSSRLRMRSTPQPRGESSMDETGSGRGNPGVYLNEEDARKLQQGIAAISSVFSNVSMPGQFNRVHVYGKR